MFQLTSQPLEKIDLRKGLTSASAGAFCSFEGIVRDHQDGKKVTALEYEALAPLCIKEADKILAEARERFALIDVRCYHRTGHLSIGEMAVWVGALAAHRAEAFAACRFTIDEIKKRLPIWKNEFYADGTSAWVNCAQHEHHHSGKNIEHG